MKIQTLTDIWSLIKWPVKQSEEKKNLTPLTNGAGETRHRHCVM